MNAPLPPGQPLQAAHSARVPLWLLALVTFSGTLAMHIFVPALPHAAADLGAGIAVMQMTVSLYIAGLALGQLTYGPLADRFGRRPVLICGLSLYTAASLASALAPDPHALIAARLFQAFGGCAGLVLGRTIVRDTAPPGETTRRLAIMNMIVMVGPGCAPVVGNTLALTMGWRSIFVLLCIMGVVSLTCAWRLLPETAPGGGAANVTVLARNYRQLLRSRSFIGYALGGGCATTSMYAYMTAAPFIFVDQLHRPPVEVGFYLMLTVLGVSVGSYLTTRLIARVPIGRLLLGGSLVTALSAFALLGLTAGGLLTAPGVGLTTLVFAIGAGVASPTALSQAVSVNPLVAGSASGLYGFAQMLVGAICTTLVGFTHDPALGAAWVLASASVIGLASFWMALRARSGERA